MGGIEVGDLVVLHCANPKEKLWGVLTRLDSVGVGLRGFDLDSVEDWLRQERSESESLIGPSSFFLPMHRVLRLDLDQSSAAVEGYGDRYAEACGGSAREALLGSSGNDA